MHYKQIIQDEPRLVSTASTLDLQVAVFCQNEAGRLAECLSRIDAAVGERRALVSVVVNGSTDESAAIARAMSVRLRVPTEVHELPIGDKSNAINEFFYALRRAAETYVCIDGYALISPGSIDAMLRTFADHPQANAVSGVAANGRTSRAQTHRAIATGGRLHGQFYAIRPSFVRQMVEMRARLPANLYRGDGLLGSMIAHDLDPVTKPWRNDRLIAIDDATFEIQRLSPFKTSDLKRQLRRKVRQMRGLLENAAIKRLIYSGGYLALPANSDVMIRDFLHAHPLPKVALGDRIFLAMALRDHGSALLAASR